MPRPHNTEEMYSWITFHLVTEMLRQLDVFDEISAATAKGIRDHAIERMRSHRDPEFGAEAARLTRELLPLRADREEDE